MRNISLEKFYTKFGGKTSPRPFSEKLKLTISLDQWPNVLYSFFLLYGKLSIIKICWNQAADHSLSPHIKLFEKTRRGLKLVSLTHFLHNFWRKIFLLLYSINWPNFIVWLPLLCEIFGNICIAIVCKPGCGVMIQTFFLHDQKVVTKIQISWEWKELLIWNKKHCSTLLKLLKQANNTNFFGRWKSDFKANYLKIFWFPDKRFSMKNNQHQILFKISWKKCIYKDFNFLVTMGPFMVKNDVNSPSKILAPLLNLIVMT